MSATQEGVEINPRRALLGEIVKSRTEELASEIRQAGGDVSEMGVPTETPEDDPKRPAKIALADWQKMSDEDKGHAIREAEEMKANETPGQKAEREAKEADAAAAAAASEIVEEAKKTEKLKIDGQEVEVDEAKILEAGRRTLQKEMAADLRLEQATKAREEAERLRKQVEETLAKAQQPVVQQKTEQQVMAAKEESRAAIKKIQYGSEEEAAHALEEYVAKMAAQGQPKQLTESELLNILDLREAQKFVKTNYADVLGDENLKELFVTKVNRKLAAGDARPYQDICKETGDELRAWKAPAKTEPTPPGGSRAEALQRKTSVLSIPAAAARQQAKPQPPEPTTSDTIAKMRQSRGQA